MTGEDLTVEFTKVVFSEETKEILGAFVKFSADNTNVEKNQANPFFNSKYADLAGAINSSREHLAKYELAIMQHPFSLRDLVGINTILCHSSGQSISSVLLLKPVKSDPQALGSAITYARRYAYMAILGMAAEDDDGNAASQPAQGKAHDKGPHQSRGQQAQAAPKKAEADKEREVIPKPENFDQADPSHLERLEKQLARYPDLPTSLYLDLAALLHGKPMTAAALKSAIDGLAGAF